MTTPTAIRRETAYRVFAQEFRRSVVQIEGEGEKDPNYVVSPLGAKINRLHVVGQVTDVEPVGESGDVWRARVSDGTGVFTVYAGSYQPEAAHVLENLTVGDEPVYLAVTGKARTYEPEEGSIYTSIRPEAIHLVGKEERDQWILDTARLTKDRLEALGKLRANPSTTTTQLADGGVRIDVAEGAFLAQERYGSDQDVSYYWNVIKEALQGIVPGGEVQVHRITPREDDGGAGSASEEAAPTWTPPQAAAPKVDPQVQAAQDEMDDAILAVVKRLESGDGARWDDILQQPEAQKAGSEDVEEALNRLMDKGIIYEPTLGVLKTT